MFPRTCEENLVFIILFRISRQVENIFYCMHKPQKMVEQKWISTFVYGKEL